MTKQKRCVQKDKESTLGFSEFLDTMPGLADIPNWENDPELLREIGLHNEPPDEAKVEDQ